MCENSLCLGKVASISLELDVRDGAHADFAHVKPAVLLTSVLQDDAQRCVNNDIV